MPDSKAITTEVKPKKAKEVHDIYEIALGIQNGKAKGQYLYCLEDDRFYHYNKGYWEPLFEIEFLGRLEENMAGMVKYPPNYKKQIMQTFKTRGRKSLSGFNWSEMLNLENGMINPYDGVLSDHDSIFYSTIRMPYKFDKDSKCPLWLKTLEEIMEGNKEKVTILQEFFGYCLTRDVKHHKALLLLGESRSGKSTILQTLRNVIGSQNCSSVPLKYISNPQYTAMLINKLVNIDTDVSAKAEQFEAEFKTITSGEPVSVNQKYVAAFDFVPYCKIVMAANIFPRITDHSSAFYKRLILIPCDRVFNYEEQNRDLLSQLRSENPGILNWAIEGLKRLTERGKFQELDFMKNAIQDLDNDNNPINLFFEDHVEIIMGSFIEKEELYKKYKFWADDTKNYSQSKNRFSNCVYKQFHANTPKDSRLPDNGKRVWRNLKYVENKGEIIKDLSWQND